MKLKALLADIKYRRSLKLVLGDLKYEHEMKILEKGFSLFMLIKIWFTVRKQRMTITGIAVEGKKDVNVIVEHPIIKYAIRGKSVHWKNGIFVQCEPVKTETYFLHFKNVLEELKK